MMTSCSRQLFSPYYIRTVNFKPYCRFFFFFVNAFIPHIWGQLPVSFSFALPYLKSMSSSKQQDHSYLLLSIINLHPLLWPTPAPMFLFTLISPLISQITRHNFFSQHHVQPVSTAILSHFPSYILCS